jgi:opacity protein-like surface antigen
VYLLNKFFKYTLLHFINLKIEIMKNLIICVFFVFSSSFIYAQKWNIGLIGGINNPNIYSNESGVLSQRKNENIKHTFFSGIGISYSYMKYLNVKSEIFYEERGWLVNNSFTIDPTNGESEIAKINFFYPFLTLPVIIEGKIGNKIQLFMNTGVNTSLRIGGKTITENGEIPLVFVFPEDKKPTFDFGWIWGVGVRIKISNRLSLQSEYRYYRSWTPIGVGYSFDSVLKHKGFLLGMACYYML